MTLCKEKRGWDREYDPEGPLRIQILSKCPYKCGVLMFIVINLRVLGNVFKVVLVKEREVRINGQKHVRGDRVKRSDGCVMEGQKGEYLSGRDG